MQNLVERLQTYNQGRDPRLLALKYTQYYAAQVEQDYRAFCAAFDSGRFSS